MQKELRLKLTISPSLKARARIHAERKNTRVKRLRWGVAKRRINSWYERHFQTVVVVVVVVDDDDDDDSSYLVLLPDHFFIIQEQNPLLISTRIVLVLCISLRLSSVFLFFSHCQLPLYPCRKRRKLTKKGPLKIYDFYEAQWKAERNFGGRALMAVPPFSLLCAPSPFPYPLFYHFCHPYCRLILIAVFLTTNHHLFLRQALSTPYCYR